MYNVILCRYNEIATKGNNRGMFENKLMDSLRRYCDGVFEPKFSRLRGRILIRKQSGEEFTEEEMEKITSSFKYCFGLASFSFCKQGKPDMDELRAMARELLPMEFRKFQREGHAVRFRTRARRSDKTFPVKSRDVEIEFATLVEELFGVDKVKVDLTDPEISIGVEIRERESMIYFSTVEAPGGLPVGSNSPVLALLSGGIDSPVACHMTMKRGCHVDFLTFHSYPYTPEESLDKVKRLAHIINRYQKCGTLYACNISNLQKLIRDNCSERCRTVLYRRMMMRIASMICEKHELCAVVTGESVGQVASQTIANMSVIDNASRYLVLRPLCGFDKNETISRAEEMGTFETSIEPFPDSCTVFAPNSPVLNAKLHTIEFEESRIPDLDKALADTFNSIEAFTGL